MNVIAVVVLLGFFYMGLCYGVQSDGLVLSLQKSGKQEVEIQDIEKNELADQEESDTKGNRNIGLKGQCKLLCEQTYYGIPCGILAVVLTIVIGSIWAK